MQWLKLTLAYDGTDFAGWQVQPGQRTVQAELEQTLQELTGETIATVASGRTDAGVHAHGQVVSFCTASQLDAATLLRALNARLSMDIVARKIEPAQPGFHAIRDAIRKRYRYYLHDGLQRDLFSRRYVWQRRRPLTEVAMHRAAQYLVGEQDFASFQSVGGDCESSVRRMERMTVFRPPSSDGNLIAIDMIANGFLYHMARAITGTLVEVGRGARDETWIAEVLAARDRSLAGMTAPAHGLFLMEVEYDT